MFCRSLFVIPVQVPHSIFRFLCTVLQIIVCQSHSCSSFYLQVSVYCFVDHCLSFPFMFLILSLGFCVLLCKSLFVPCVLCGVLQIIVCLLLSVWCFVDHCLSLAFCVVLCRSLFVLVFCVVLCRSLFVPCFLCGVLQIIVCPLLSVWCFVDHCLSLFSVWCFVDHCLSLAFCVVLCRSLFVTCFLCGVLQSLGNFVFDGIYNGKTLSFVMS